MFYYLVNTDADRNQSNYEKRQHQTNGGLKKAREIINNYDK